MSLDELHPSTSSGFGDESRIMLLQNAVSEIEELDRVRTDQRLLNKTNMVFEEYADIFELAAIDYDEKFQENKVSRTAYFTKLGAQEDPSLLTSSEYNQEEDVDDDDSPSSRELFNTNVKKPSFGSPKPSKSYPPRPITQQAGERPGDLASKVWQALSPDVKKAINEARNKVRTVNLCDMKEMDPDNDQDIPPEEAQQEDEDNPLLEFLCGNLEHPSYGDIREVLATKRTRGAPHKK